MFRIVYEIAIAVGLLYLVIWLAFTLTAEARRRRADARAGQAREQRALPGVDQRVGRGREEDS